MTKQEFKLFMGFMSGCRKKADKEDLETVIRLYLKEMVDSENEEALETLVKGLAYTIYEVLDVELFYKPLEFADWEGK